MIVGYSRSPSEGLPLAPGALVTYRIHVKNIGVAAWDQAIVVGWRLTAIQPTPEASGILFRMIGIAKGLLPGQTSDAKIPIILSAPADSTYEADFTVDPDDMAPESNEMNNTLGPLTLTYGS